MQRKFTGFSVLSFAFLLIISSCTKIDTTTIGGDLVGVDNEVTFADTLDVISTQGTFTDNITTTNRSSNYVLGAITNDPVFGKTTGEVYVELKPNFFPYYFGSAGDTINTALIPETRFDSAVLCLSYKFFYGDTNKVQSFKVYTISNSTSDFADSTYKLNYRPNGGLGDLVGTGTIDPKRVGDSIYFPGSAKANIINQVRIKLNNEFLTELTSGWDTASGSSSVYRSDTNFRAKYRGFAIVPDENTQGNGLFYVNLTDAATRLELHYVKRNKGVLDTSFSSFALTNGYSTVLNAAHANYVQRDSTGTELKDNRQPGALYIQSTPGTFAYLSIPGLANRTNQIVHRAEIYVEQITSNDPVISAIDEALIPPPFLYLDLIDSASTTPQQFKPIYLDLNPSSVYDPDNSITYFPSAGIDNNYFGGYRRYRDGGNGKRIFYYTFNLSRYVQGISTNGRHNYKFRLYAPVDLYYKGYKTAYSNNSIALGRIKIGDGSDTAKMRMRIVYSKIL